MEKKNWHVFIEVMVLCLFLIIPNQQVHAESNEWAYIYIYKGEGAHLIVKDENIRLAEWKLLRDGKKIVTATSSRKYLKNNDIPKVKMPGEIEENMQIGDIISIKIEKLNDNKQPIESEEPKWLNVRVNGLTLILYKDEEAETNKEAMKIHYLGKGDTIKFPEAEKEGYIFKGWKDMKSNKTYPVGSVWESKQSLLEKTFIGIWEIDENFGEDVEETPEEEQQEEEKNPKPDEKPEERPENKPEKKPNQDSIGHKKPEKPGIGQLTFSMNDKTGTIYGSEEILKDIHQVHVKKTDRSHHFALYDRKDKEVKPNEWMWIDLPLPEDLMNKQYRVLVDSRETIYKKMPEKGCVRIAIRFNDEEIKYKTIQKDEIKIHGTTWALNGAEKLIIKNHKEKQEYLLADKNGNIISTRGPVWIEMPKQEAKHILSEGQYHGFKKERATIKIPIDF